jgi:hypothetical protein
MKMIAVVLACLVTSFLSACATPATTQTPAQILANFHTQVTKACAVAQPTLLSLQAMSSQLTVAQQADLAKASEVITTVCSAPTPAITSVQDLVNVAVPAAIKIIAASPMKDADKTTAEIALTAASIAVSAALAQYVTVPAAASAPVAASA